MATPTNLLFGLAIASARQLSLFLPNRVLGVFEGRRWRGPQRRVGGAKGCKLQVERKSLGICDQTRRVRKVDPLHSASESLNWMYLLWLACQRTRTPLLHQWVQVP